MARMICFHCGQYMSDNSDYLDFIFYCFSDTLFKKTAKESKKRENEYFHMPENTPSIWRCPQCKTIFWFEHNDRKNGIVFNSTKKIPAVEYNNGLICECGHRFHNSELIHCYPDVQRSDIWEQIDDAYEFSLPIPEFEDSQVHIWKCPDCNRLYWIERDSGIVQCYEKKES